LRDNTPVSSSVDRLHECKCLPRTIFELSPQFRVAGVFEALLSRWRNVAFLAQNMPFEAYVPYARRLHPRRIFGPKKETSEVKMKKIYFVY